MTRCLALFVLLVAAEGRRFPIQQQEFGLATAFNYYPGKVHQSRRNEVLQRSIANEVGRNEVLAHRSEPQMLFGLGKNKKTVALGLAAVWALRQKFKGKKSAKKPAPAPAPPPPPEEPTPPPVEEVVPAPPPPPVEPEEDADPFKIPEFEPVEEVLMTTTGGVEKETIISVEPFLTTYEKYIVGFTTDSDSAFKIIGEKEIEASEVTKSGDVQETATVKTEVRESSGTMNRRGSDPTEITIKCEPGARIGELVAYLSFIPVEEKMFAKYFKIIMNAKA